MGSIIVDRRTQARFALLRQMQEDGVRYIFGNPGSTEEGFLDALTDTPALHYVLGLQESIVAAMADGYARVTRRPAVVQLHAAVGLGNAMAILYQAHRSGTPLVVFAGEGESRDADLDGFLAADLVRIAEPVTKWSHRVTHAAHLQRTWRRAVKVAATPPQGPVFLALPLDVLDEEVPIDNRPSPVVHLAGAPPPGAIAAAADRLVHAANPLLLCGDGIAANGGMATVGLLSEAIGAPVYGVELSDLGDALRLPLFLDLLSHGFGDLNRRVTAEADVVLAVGTPLFPELFASRAPHFRDGAFLIHLDANPWEISKNHCADVGAWGDPCAALTAISAAVQQRLDPGSRAAARERVARWSARKAELREARQRAYDSVVAEGGAMTPAELGRGVAEAVPAGALIYDELITSSDELRHFLRLDRGGAYLLGRGGCIGVGWPGAIGAKLAWRGPVIALSGDGSASYVTQCLWTAVHERLDIVFVVANNCSYRILKVNLLAYWAERGMPVRGFSNMDLASPSMDFTLIARGYGAEGHVVSDPAALRATIERAIAHGGVHVVDARVSGSVEDEVKARFSSRSAAARS